MTVPSFISHFVSSFFLSFVMDVLLGQHIFTPKPTYFLILVRRPFHKKCLGSSYSSIITEEALYVNWMSQICLVVDAVGNAILPLQ